MPSLGLLSASSFAAVLSTGVAAKSHYLSEFKEYVHKFEKKYRDEVEKAARLAAFQENYRFIEEENSKGHDYELGLNHFADMTPDEFALTHFGLRQPRGRMWGTLPSLGVHTASNKTLPSAVDWTQKGAVTPVKNQAQCGSCWAFSTTGSLEGAWAIATGKLVSLSEQQLVDCAKKFGEQGCNGGIMDNAFQYAEQTDMCQEASYPYLAKNGICKASACTVGIPKGGVVGFKDVAVDSVNALMDAVAQQPVSIAIEADKSVFQLYKKGILSLDCGTNLDHGVLLVGYGTDGGKAYWKVKNSWGSTWGESGYIRLARGTKGAGECGLESQPSYPVVKGAPGPAPGPSPPAPPSPPSPPTPSTTHYEKPPCQSDEVQASVESFDGEVCAPPCTGSASCPTDVPEGTSAIPTCSLQDASSGEKYCALMCFSDSSCPSGAKCGKSGFLGICVYSMSERSPLTLAIAEPKGTAIINV